MCILLFLYESKNDYNCQSQTPFKINYNLYCTGHHTMFSIQVCVSCRCYRHAFVANKSSMLSILSARLCWTQMWFYRVSHTTTAYSFLLSGLKKQSHSKVFVTWLTRITHTTRDIIWEDAITSESSLGQSPGAHPTRPPCVHTPGRTAGTCYRPPRPAEPPWSAPSPPSSSAPRRGAGVGLRTRQRRKNY